MKKSKSFSASALFKYCKLLHEERIDVPKNGPLTELVVGKTFGQGIGGIVRQLIEVKSGREFALREAYRQSQEFVPIQIELAKYQMAPNVYIAGQAECKQEIFSFVIMDTIKNSVLEYLQRNGNQNKLADAYECLLDKKYLLGILHGDAHSNNLVLLKDGVTLGFIDFDFSAFKVSPEVNVLDFVSIIGDLLEISKRTNINSSVLVDRLLMYYKNRFNMIIDKSLFFSMKTGGYGYGNNEKNYLESYGKTKFLIERFMKYFPTFKRPRIVT